MPTPINERPLPEHVEVPDLPPAMAAWAEFVARAEGMVVKHNRAELTIDAVLDGRSAARALEGYRYSRVGREWIDAAGDAPGQWRREWLVIGDDADDPFIADLSTPAVAVLKARHGQGSWRPRRVSASLAEFIDSLRIIDPATIRPRSPRAATATAPPAPNDTSVTVVDWGADEAGARDYLLWSWRQFGTKNALKQTELPMLVIPALSRSLAEVVLREMSRHGATVTLGPAVQRHPRSARPESS